MNTLPLNVIKGSESIIYLPKALKHLKRIEQLSFGTISCSCTVKIREDEEQVLSISEDLFTTLKIPYTSTTYLIEHEDTLYLGPLVGIFTAGFTDSMLRPIGERSIFFSKLLSAEKAVGAFAFVFGAHHIDWDNGLITGLFYLKNGWKKIQVPFPNVIYDRLPNRKVENHSALKKVKHKLSKEYLIPWFNPGFFNKWEIHKLLVNDQTVANYLPETHKNPSFTLIETMLAQYQHVYLKPANGSLGLGVYQIIYSREEESYYCRFKDVETQKNRLQKYSSLEALINHLFRDKELKSYIVQQGITLIRKNHKTIDFRVHTNKNKDGRWQLSVIAAKIAGRGSVTTHINSGGVVKTLDELFTDKEEALAISRKLKEASLLLSKAIDSKIDGPLGEIGFDLGIDKNGDIWVFEANSKPGRSIFSHPKLRNYDLLTRKLFLQYAIHLTETMIKMPEEIHQ
ncbi:YheC/YheD family protein [Bacillus sp. PS06]|uniref:YheC/YheD family endospore coat-associated protein n=1 Tax=Bacillus sp. PS06 TaxID=2764176 RepID=UPI001785E2BF|nr:YheC/YheD family protein [Bacillus sp. PS06]MBD8067740.1 YheC/YheD family protein [Bacillus sp. PS06]